MNTTTRRSIGILVLVAVVIGVFILVRHDSPGTSSVTPPTPPTSVQNTYGMSEYTDPTYGFSFWYPSALAVTSASTADSTDFPGGVAVETVQIGSAGGTTVTVVNSPTSTITDEPPGHASPIPATEYSYDSTLSQWMVSYPEGAMTAGASAAPTPANVSTATMSGLVMLPSGKRFDTTIIPLSTTRFLVVSDGGGSSFTDQLAATVALTSASVDPSTQASALEAEATAYGVGNE